MQTQLDAVRDLFDHRVCSVGRASPEDPPIFASSFQALDEEINRWLQSGDLKELPAEQLAAYLRCLNALQEQVKWNRLVPILISLSAQLPRLVTIRAKAAERLHLTRYLGNVSLFFIALAVLLAGLTDWLVNL